MLKLYSNLYEVRKKLISKEVYYNVYGVNVNILRNLFVSKIKDVWIFIRKFYFIL